MKVYYKKHIGQDCYVVCNLETNRFFYLCNGEYLEITPEHAGNVVTDGKFYWLNPNCEHAKEVSNKFKGLE